MTMSSHWVCRRDTITQNLVYERPLGLTESGFYWDSVANRTADTLYHAEIDIVSTGPDQLLALPNVRAAWLILKQRFPLLGARLEERGPESISFVIEVERLKTLSSQEVILDIVASYEHAWDYARSLVTSQLVLSNDLLTCLFVLRRSDKPTTVHILLNLAHCITDGMGNITLLKSFLNVLSLDTPIPAYDLQEQLRLSSALEDLATHGAVILARKRWKFAIAATIVSRRNTRLTGGHTIPRHVSLATPYTPADSGRISVSFSSDKSVLFIRSCRKYGITFGCAHPILAQMATTRVLLRRYLKGEIPQVEWDFRRREPMIYAGPLNFRPYLDKEWLQAGGGSHVSLSIGFFFYALPFMPLGNAKLTPGMELPDFGQLLSQSRFILRCRNLKRQSDSYLKHPLLTEMAFQHLPSRLERLRDVGVQYRSSESSKHRYSVPLTPVEEASLDFVLGPGGSSMGNIDRMLPRMYPTNDADQKVFRLVKTETHLHCRPAEFYLGATTSQDQLHLHVFWDKNVYEETIVKEWLKEVQEATQYYLG